MSINHEAGEIGCAFVIEEGLLKITDLRFFTSDFSRLEARQVGEGT